MSNKTLGLDPALYDYLLSVSLRESDLLKQLRAETAAHPWARMQIAPEQGQFMGLLVELMGVTKALEIGVFTGYSSLSVALALPVDGQLIACDVNQDFTAIARRYWEMAGVSDKIDLHLAPALETLDKLLAANQAGTFDFVFIDADKTNYSAYYERSLQLLRVGGLMLVDNVLWGGSVLNTQTEDVNTLAIQAFNRKILEDQRVSISLVPIGDGLTLMRKRVV
jgi:predicted O-methyltransferase YrrM